MLTDTGCFCTTITYRSPQIWVDVRDAGDGSVGLIVWTPLSEYFLAVRQKYSVSANIPFSGELYELVRARPVMII